MLSHLVNSVSRMFGVETKFDTTFAMAYMHTLGRAVWSPKDYEAFSREGYKKNAIVFRCVQLTAQHASRVQLCLHDKNGDEIEDHPVLDLLKKPNPRQSGQKFLEAVVAYYRISGNSFMYAVTANGKVTMNAPDELWVLRPDRMKIVPGRKGIERYEYKVGAQEPFVFEVDPMTGASAVRHMKTFNPTDDLWGMSPIEAAMYAVDQNNAAGEWNKALLDNGGKPSGAFVVGSEGGISTATLTDAQYERLKSRIDEQVGGPKNAGRALILEGGLDWKEMGLSPKDMDWIEGRNATAREICQVFNTSPMMIGLPGDNTYANMAEARLSLYEDNVLPLLDEICYELNSWLLPMYPDLEGAELKVDRDDIDALAPRRKEKWEMVANAAFLSVNEKRKALDYDELDIPEADEVFVPSGLLPLRGSMADPNVDPNVDPNADKKPGDKPGEKPPVEKPNAEDDMEKAMRRLESYIESKYSEDQPRDERGRFAGGSTFTSPAKTGSSPAPAPKQEYNKEFRRQDHPATAGGKYTGPKEHLADHKSMTEALKANGAATVEIHPSVDELSSDHKRILMGSILNSNHDQPMEGVGGKITVAVDKNLPPNAGAVMRTHMAPVTEALTHTMVLHPSEIKNVAERNAGRLPHGGMNAAPPGWFASGGDLRSTINHEVAHARTSKDLMFGTKTMRSMKVGETKIAARVSQYAATNKVEFIAEAVAGHLSGRVYDADVHGQFTKYTGKSIADFVKGKP